MDKRRILSEIVFESSGELIRNCGQSPLSALFSVEHWALVVGPVQHRMLVNKAWPYLHHIIWITRGLDVGIATVSIKLEFKPDEVPSMAVRSSLIGHGCNAQRQVSGV